jgi:hypothetical protein
MVGEFLIGDHAFGTMASLNVASQSLHLETLAVLYETVLVVKPKSRANRRSRSSGLKYTKYVVGSRPKVSLIRYDPQVCALCECR